MSKIEPEENVEYDDPIESISNDAVARGLSNDQVWAIWQAGISARARELELEDLLISARAIAERKGEGTAWQRFSERLRKAGIGFVTPRTFRVLPSDEAQPTLALDADECPACGAALPPSLLCPDCHTHWKRRQ